jgi:hypothetical protein
MRERNASMNQVHVLVKIRIIIIKGNLNAQQLRGKSGSVEERIKAMEIYTHRKYTHIHLQKGKDEWLCLLKLT